MLVHCAQGKSRSAVLAVAYLILRHEMTVTEAMSTIKARRGMAEPNPGFRQQLADMERSLRKK